MIMSKRKRERLDVGRHNDQKKPKPSGEVDGIPTPHGNREKTIGREMVDEDALASAVDREGEAKTIRRSKKAKRTNVQEESEGQNERIQTVPSSNDAPRNITQPGDVSTSCEKLELQVVRTKKKKVKKVKKTKEPPENAEEVPSQRTSSRRKKRKRSETEMSFWKVSDVVGGQMLDLDPIFALNEE